MPKKMKKVKCIDCGKLFRVSELNRNRRCSKCSLIVMRQLGRDMHAKRGKYYERWKTGLKRAVKKL